MYSFRIAMAQINASVGDLEGNTSKILQFIDQARDMRADLVTFPELSITGYPPEDLLLKPDFIAANLDCLEKIVDASSDISVVLGFVDSDYDIYNAAAIICNGKLAGVYHKIYLPNYGVFDEDRYFQAGTEPLVFSLNGVTVGVNICEDIWYPGGPMNAEALEGGAEVIVNISASPYHAGKGEFRRRMLSTRAADNVVIIAFNNLVGGQDELVFDGSGMIFDQNGELTALGRQFEEDFIVTDLDINAVFRRRLHDPRHRKERFARKTSPSPVKRLKLEYSKISGEKPPLKKRKQLREAISAAVLSVGSLPRQPSRESGRSAELKNNSELRTPNSEFRGGMSRLEEIYNALVLGTRDYVKKNGFSEVVIGLSGGIDSSLTATIAVDALGKENVVGVSMPSQYSSEETKSDAQKLAENLGMKFLVVPIIDVFHTYLETLSGAFEGCDRDITEENIQARIRGNILMALSNKFGYLVLTTGNKSEASVGYCTLYGDMAGGFAVIKDLPKMLVYQLASFRNSLSDGDTIPQSVIERAPSAELRPDQKDSDSLPPYEILDQILQAYVEEDRSFDEIVAMGFSEDIVKEVIRMVNRNEYKRRQSPPGIKITPRAFGKDRRLPITNKYSGQIADC